MSGTASDPRDPREHTAEQFCYLITTGRVTGRPHEIEIWFAISGPTLYMLAGGRYDSDWVKNIQKNPRVSVRIGTMRFTGEGRVVTDAEEDALARRIVVAKYQPGYGEDLSSWGRASLPLAVDLLVMQEAG